MFKDGVNLRSDAWYMKLMRFMWKAEWYDFPNLCPLFWAVMGSIVIFPIWAVVKIIEKILSVKIISFEWGKAKTNVMTIGKIFYKLFVLVFGIFLALTFGILFTYTIQGLIVSTYEYTIFICSLIGGIVVVCGIGFYFIHFAIEDDNVYGDIDKYNKLVTAPYYFVKWLVQPFKWLYDTVVIIFAFFYSIYKKCCPLIKWD